MQLSTNFQKRILVGGSLLLFASLFIIFSHSLIGSFLFCMALFSIQVCALFEYFSLCSMKGFLPAKWMVYIFSFFFFLSRYLSTIYPDTSLLSFSLLFFTFLACSLIFFMNKEQAIANVAVSFFSFLYITLPVSFLFDLNAFPKSAAPTSFWLVFLLIVVKGSDVFAYFVGKSLGKHLLAKEISPGKTIEGAIGGILGGALLGALLSVYSPISNSLSSFEGAVLGLVIAIFALLGDLIESVLKRDAKVKDSNNLPGLGGALDILDSILVTSPLLYLWLLYTSRI